MDATDFQPFTAYDDLTGFSILVRNPAITLPDAIAAKLPKRFELDRVHRRFTGPSWYGLGRDSGFGTLNFPSAPGDGIPSLRQIESFLGRHGYRDLTGTPEARGGIVWERGD